MNVEAPLHGSLHHEAREPEGEAVEVGKRVFAFLDRTGFLKLRKSDEQFEEWLQRLSYDQFQSFLTRLNGFLRKKPIQKRFVDGSNVEVSFGITGDTGYLPPESDQKDELLHETFDAVQQLADNEGRALLTYYALQAIHPYADGNGRTGRLAYKLLSDEGQQMSESELSELMDHDQEGSAGTGKGRDSFAKKVVEPEKAYYIVNREVAKQFLGDQFSEEYGSIYVAGTVGVGFVPEKVKETLTQKENERAAKILGEGDTPEFPFRGLVLVKLLQEFPDLQQYQYDVQRALKEDQVLSEDVGKKVFGIDGEEIMGNLNMTEIRRLLEIHREVKTKFIHTLIDIFTHPDDHTALSRDGVPAPIKTAFIRSPE